MSFGQDIKVSDHNSYDTLVKTLQNSKTILYEDILEQYDTYIKENPDDIRVRVYRCRFIGTAYYDEYEDYDTNYEATEACIDELYDAHASNPEVALYKLENVYGETKEALLDEIFERYESDKSIWEYNQIAELYRTAAYYYEDINDFKAIRYAEQTERYSDSLDMSILLTKAHRRMGNDEKAKDNLMESLYRDHDAWILQQKGDLLIEFEEFDEALKMFDRVEKKDSSYTNNGNLYKIFEGHEDYEKARTYLLKDTIMEWRKFEALQKLFIHDYKYGTSDEALASYRRLQSESFYDDILGIKRLKLFFKSPLSPWNAQDFAHLGVLLLVIVFLLLIPYLWILPVYNAKKIFTVKPVLNNLSKLKFNLRHFWLISFVYLFGQLLVTLVFYYTDEVNYLFDLGSVYYDKGIEESTEVLVNKVLLFSGFLLVSTLLFLNRKRFKYIFNTNLNLGQIIGISILFLVGKAFLVRILGLFVDLDTDLLEDSYSSVLSIMTEIQAMLDTYGFGVSVLILAIIVPFYEEIMFRGIILGSVQNHIGFIWANIFQAALFALVHFNLELSIFYFFFGIVTGIAAKRTNGLFMSIIIHAVNNFFVLLAMVLARHLLAY